ncbi:VC0807 family protein [Lysinibacillus sp. FJAT-14745]|uniref:VC0807 family protein n=1 Tax=Lysinibacillus sp. FJAT-14745 TaxID=1704289 RepID=UPI001F1D1B8F|nr:VC0807 family protein [Lysinibacillus sp. FJAT-14745]
MKKQHSNKKLILLDLIFYVALPYIIWNFGREPFGHYVAMLISTIPGIIYTIYRFILDKQFNITGLFILGSLALGTTVDLLSGSAEQMIWNGIYLSLFYSFLYFVSLVIKRPFSLYFAVDFVYLQGYERKDSRALFYQKGIFKWFQFIQVIFIIRGLFMAGLTVFLLNNFGIDGYGEMLIYKQISGWIFSGLIMGMFFYINIPVQKFFAKQQKQLQDKKI